MKNVSTESEKVEAQAQVIRETKELKREADHEALSAKQQQQRLAQQQQQQILAQQQQQQILAQQQQQQILAQQQQQQRLAQQQQQQRLAQQQQQRQRPKLTQQQQRLARQQQKDQILAQQQQKDQILAQQQHQQRLAQQSQKQRPRQRLAQQRQRPRPRLARKMSVLPTELAKEIEMKDKTRINILNSLGNVVRLDSKHADGKLLAQKLGLRITRPQTIDETIARYRLHVITEASASNVPPEDLVTLNNVSIADCAFVFSGASGPASVEEALQRADVQFRINTISADPFAVRYKRVPMSNVDTLRGVERVVRETSGVICSRICIAAGKSSGTIDDKAKTWVTDVVKRGVTRARVILGKGTGQLRNPDNALGAVIIKILNGQNGDAISVVGTEADLNQATKIYNCDTVSDTLAAVEVKISAQMANLPLETSGEFANAMNNLSADEAERDEFIAAIGGYEADSPFCNGKRRVNETVQAFVDSTLRKWGVGWTSYEVVDNTNTPQTERAVEEINNALERLDPGSENFQRERGQLFKRMTEIKLHTKIDQRMDILNGRFRDFEDAKKSESFPTEFVAILALAVSGFVMFGEDGNIHIIRFLALHSTIPSTRGRDDGSEGASDAVKTLGDMFTIENMASDVDLDDNINVVKDFVR
jgi:hypothetical protein